ncbi:MAG: MmcQ/YjbR family DNA-binding protein [Albidovulum sp.]
MTGDEFNRFCAALPHTTHVVQWGGADVWKIGGKVFAIGGWNAGETYAVTFKVSELMYEVLRDQPGCRPAPYLASRGMKWIQRWGPEGPKDAELTDLIERSYAMIRAKLPKRLRTTWEEGEG